MLVFYLSFLFRDSMQGTTNRTKDVLAEAGFQNVTANDVAVAQHISAVISHRAALLVATTTSVILARLVDPDVTIAIDGSVYKNHPRMHEWLTRIIGKLNTTKKIVRNKKLPRFYISFNISISNLSVFVGVVSFSFS